MSAECPRSGLSNFEFCCKSTPSYKVTNAALTCPGFLWRPQEGEGKRPLPGLAFQVASSLHLACRARSSPRRCSSGMGGLRIFFFCKTRTRAAIGARKDPLGWTPNRLGSGLQKKTMSHPGTAHQGIRETNCEIAPSQGPAPRLVGKKKKKNKKKQKNIKQQQCQTPNGPLFPKNQTGT